MPAKIVIPLKNINLDDVPTYKEIEVWVKSMEFTKEEYAKLCKNKRFLLILDQPLKVTMELAIEILGLNNKQELNPS